MRNSLSQTSGVTPNFNPAYDVFKGIAILLIVIGHNKYIGQFSPAIFAVLYNFHVWAFFFILTAYPIQRTSAVIFRDIITRTMVPNICFIIMVSFLFYVSSLRKEISVLEFIPTFLNGIFFQTAQTLSKSTGFQLYWFLPSFCVFSIFWKILSHTHGKLNIALIAFLVIAHLFIGLIPQSIAPWIFFGLAPALYILPLAILAKHITEIAAHRNIHALIFSGAAFATLTTVSLIMGTTVNLGYLLLFGINDLSLMLLHDAIALLGFMMLLSLAKVIRTNNFLQTIGRNSLYIFLVHQVIFQMIYQLLPSTHTSATSSVSLIFYGIISLIISVMASFLLAAIITKFVLLRKAVFPRSFAEWTSVYPSRQ